MSSKITKVLLICAFSSFAQPASAQFGIDWTDLATSIIDESARSGVQKVFESLSNTNFPNAKLSVFRKQAQQMGLKNPTTVEALMLFEQGIRPLEVSPFPIIANKKISTIGDGAFLNIGNKVYDGIRADLAKNNLTDYLSQTTLSQLNEIDEDGTLQMKIKGAINPKFALFLNTRPECLLTLKQHPALLKFGHLPLISYFTHATQHADQFKKNAIPDISTWDFDVSNNDTLFITAQSGQIGTLTRTSDTNQFLINVADDDPLWLNCSLPHSSIINFGSSSLITDRVGRIIEVRFSLVKAKFKDKQKRQLKSMDILSARGDSELKATMLIPKNYGGTETWNNVIAYAETKANKQSLKTLDKRLSQLAKEYNKTVSVRLSYNSSSDTPSAIQYYCEGELICTIK